MFKREKVEKLNNAVVASNAKCWLFPGKEFLAGLTIIIGAAEFTRRGSDIFGMKDQVADHDDNDNKVWPSVCHDPHLSSICHLAGGTICGTSLLKFSLMKQKKIPTLGISFLQ
jgi:hypothetical protein